MIDRLLIANRGEIACRIARTCRRLGVQTVAVHSDADAQARHVREADRAVRIGAAPARESYLDAQAIVRAALSQGAQAVHPGYGFLSERLELVDVCQAAGLVFIGPHREAIERMGSKIESKRIARTAGVACVPGYDGDAQDAARLAEEARRIGFPLLVKASAGGGGKGMQRVDRAEDFLRLLAAAREAARAAFGDDRVLLERCIERPRHLEVQLLGDRHGHLVHLFERECSIQRLYQKLVEEAPAPHLAPAVQARLIDSALALGRAIGYDSVGTVEFVLDAAQGDEPYFLEMNTRLQVEHTVTEMTTGLDLVELQIRSALGEALPLAQSDIRRSGWAIEARVNAEVPDEGWRASFGRVTEYVEPQASALRIDSGIDAASEVTPHYDALLVKLIGQGATRAEAADRLRAGLRGLHIGGVRTNQALLDAILGHPAFAAPLSTRFLAEAFPGGWRRPAGQLAEQQAVAAVASFQAALQGPGASDRPMDTLVGLRLTAPAGRAARSRLFVGEPGAMQAVDLECRGPGTFVARVGTVVFTVDSEAAGTRLRAGARIYQARQEPDGVALWCKGDGRGWIVHDDLSTRGDAASARAESGTVRADLPGVVARILVQAGQAVSSGDPLVVIESMKLFHTLCAPRAGTVARVLATAGVTVQRGAVLVVLDDTNAPDGGDRIPT